MSIISVAAQLACRDIYTPVTFKNFRKIYTVGSTVCGTRLFDGVFYIVNQGTSNQAGWHEDFECSLYEHPILGRLHYGFQDNLPELIKQLLPDIPLNIPVVCTGHSKGAGEASQLAAELYLLNIPIKQSILFACPNSGDSRFANWLSGHISGVSYRNAILGGLFGDPVPLVPAEEFIKPYPHTLFAQYPVNIFDRPIPTKWHNAALYYTACSKM